MNQAVPLPDFVSSNRILRKGLRKLGVRFVNIDKTEIGNMRAPVLPADLLKNCRVLPHRLDALPLVPKGGRIAEIGVAYGDLSEKLLAQIRPDKFHSIDTFEMGPGKELWGRTTLSDANRSHREYIEDRFREQISQGTVEIHEGYSWDVLQRFPDQHFDYIYVDGDHSYDGVSKDIEQVKLKIKDGGIIQFNDYCTMFSGGAACGVQRAVNEFMIAERYEMLYFCMQDMGYADVLLRKQQ